MSVQASVERVPRLAAARSSTAALTVFRLAGLFTFLTAAMGAVVSATKSGAACPTWPGCNPGEIAPPLAMSPVIEFTHRVVAMTTGLLILGAALTGGRLRRPDRWVRALPWVAMVGAIASAAFGRRVVLDGIPAYLSAIDLLCALIAMTAMGAGAVLAARPALPTAADPESRAWRPTPPHHVLIARIAATSVGVLIVMHVTGILAAGRSSYTSSMGWPLWEIIASDRYPWLQVLRLVLAGVAVVLVVATAVLATRAWLRGWGLAIASALIAELLLGVLIRTQGLHLGLAATHSVLAVALLCGLGVLTTTLVTHQ